MIRETALALYLAVVRVIFTLSKLFPLRNKTVMFASFGDNVQHVMNEVKRETSSNIYVLKEPGCSYPFEGVDEKHIIRFTPLRILSFIKGIYHLATAKFIFVDNYHAVLAACSFRSGVTCTQLWHANGAVKLFGLKDRTTGGRSASAHRRFQQVYSRFHKVVVSSDRMAEIFKEAFGLNDDNILKTGMPRTDFFHSQERLAEARKNTQKQLPEIRGKRAILYAPTFRDDDFKVSSIHLDIELMEKELSEDYHLLVRLHPAVKFEGSLESPFITDVSRGYDIFELLSATDILITDYSSIPFEFSILQRPMIFHPYDLEEYEEKRGIWFDYEQFVPGPVAYTAEGIISVIQENRFDEEKIRAFNEIWNKYADGRSTKRLVDVLYKNASGD